MTTLIAHVWRDTDVPRGPRPWIAAATALDVFDTGHQSRSRAAYAPSWPEAMQAAYKLLADLDRELMDEIHASRSSRRKASR